MSKPKLSRFFQTNKFHSTPDTSNEKGTCLGLIITRELIEKMQVNYVSKAKIEKDLHLWLNYQ